MAIRSEIQKQAQSTILQYAIFRWESAVVVALVLILFFLFPHPFAWWPSFGWPLLGILAVAGLIYSSLTDAEGNAQVLLSLFQEQFDPRAIREPALRQSFENALEYQRRIEMQIRKQKASAMRDRLEATAGQITDWISNVYQLALRIDTYRADKLLAAELKTLPDEIKKLEAQQRLEPNLSVQNKMQEVLQGKTEHWKTLRELDARMKQASLQIDQSLTALATIYSQIQLVDAESINSGRADRLQSDIREQVARMNDLLTSINEVYEFNQRV